MDNVTFSFRKSKFFLNGLLILIIVMFLQTNAVAKIKDNEEYFKPLQIKLIKDGFDEKKVRNLYNRPEVSFETKGVSQFFQHSEAKLNYKQFTYKRSIKKARKYMKKHQITFENAEKEFGVDKEIITAIILVETRLGKILGSKSIINTLSTMAALSDIEVRNSIWDRFSKSGNTKREDFEKWAGRKSKWSYRELKAFLTYTEREKIDPASISGSYAGALGIAQFMPSNILSLAKDGNNDGRIDLFNHEDAIASIANYLKHYGWHPGIDRKKAYKVLFRYNHSKYYVNTLLEIADELKG